jgi:hypothetical protein
MRVGFVAVLDGGIGDNGRAGEACCREVLSGSISIGSDEMMLIDDRRPVRGWGIPSRSVGAGLGDPAEAGDAAGAGDAVDDGGMGRRRREGVAEVSMVYYHQTSSLDGCYFGCVGDKWAGYRQSGRGSRGRGGGGGYHWWKWGPGRRPRRERG